MLWPLTALSVVLVANTNGRLAIPALAGLLVHKDVDIEAVACVHNLQYRFSTDWSGPERKMKVYEFGRYGNYTHRCLR